jgi:outer membrane protein TolC
MGVNARYDWYDDKLFGDNGQSWTLMAVAKLNLFHGGSDVANLLKTKAESEGGQSDVRRFEEGVTLEVRQTYSETNSATLRLIAAKAALASARENLRVIEERFAQGVAKMTDLLDSQTSLRELEVRELNARYDRALALLHLRLATGVPILETLSEEQ